MFRFLKGVAIPLQYSVFLQIAPTLAEQRKTDEFLAKAIDPKQDDIRTYPLPETCQALRLGTPFLSPGLMIPEEWIKEFLFSTNLL